jgi:UDP-N-acetylmuramate--alanine ligase
MLGYLGQGSQTLAVSGTHGKTTTSSMLATSLMRLEQDPTFLIGGVVDGYDSSAYAGSGPYYVVEADESDGSFVYLDPHLAIITNLEADHLDHYENIEQIEFAFGAFLGKLANDGVAIVCGDCKRLATVARRSGKPFITYGLGEGCEVRCVPGRAPQEGFEVRLQDGSVQQLKLQKSPGVHNMLNATAVLAALVYLGFEPGAAAQAISAYSGARRRFDLIGSAADVDVIDDYGHHPTELKATLAAARTLGYQHIHMLFQPHRYTRTQAFMEQFAEAFDDADTLTLMDVFSAGEEPIEGVNSETLLERVQQHAGAPQARYISERADIPFVLAEQARPGDLIITQGAGDVTNLAPLILEALGGQANQSEQAGQAGQSGELSQASHLKQKTSA